MPSRRNLFRRAVSALVPLYCGLAFPFAATRTYAADAKAKPAAGEGKVLNLFIWGEYMTPDVLAAFKKKTGITVKEANYASNEELLAKIQGGAKGYDVAVPSDYMVDVMAKMGLLAALDKAKLPNAAHVDPMFLGKPYDPKNAYSLPYAWTMTGIAVNGRLYKKDVSGWMDLFANPDAKGRVSLLDDVRETMGAALKALGKSYNATGEADLRAARDLLVKAKPHVKAFSSTPGELLKSGEVVLAHMYSQEASLAARAAKGQAIRFVVPKEGSTLAIDNMVILKDAPHPAEAHAFIDFLLEPATQKLLVTRLFNGPVLKDVKALLPKDLQDDPVLFPAPATFARQDMITDVGEATETYDRFWSEIKVAK